MSYYYERVQDGARTTEVESTTQRFPETMRGAPLSVLWWSEAEEPAELGDERLAHDARD